MVAFNISHVHQNIQTTSVRAITQSVEVIYQLTILILSHLEAAVFNDKPILHWVLKSKQQTDKDSYYLVNTVEHMAKYLPDMLNWWSWWRPNKSKK